MKIKPLLECTIDLSDPITELSAVISAVVANHPDKQADILRTLDDEIGRALMEIAVSESLSIE